MTTRTNPALIKEYTAVTPAMFEQEIRGANQPAILRGLVADWPVVKAAQQSDDALVQYIADCKPTRPVRALVAPPSEGGRFYYNANMTGFNFGTGKGLLTAFLHDLLQAADDASPPALAVQSEIIETLMPAFAFANQLSLLPDVAPRIWIGNRILVAPHYDLKENIGCCVSGKRRFTLFPPEQMANLYPGPLDLTPAGTPISMVNLKDPDFAAHPNFAQAWATAHVAELEPGDAIYIPYMWWHGVESLSTINILVNYWWTDLPQEFAGPYDALLHAMMAFKHMPEKERAIWQAMVDHYVFEKSGDPASHIPLHARGILSPPSRELFQRMRSMMIQAQK